MEAIYGTASDEASARRDGQRVGIKGGLLECREDTGESWKKGREVKCGGMKWSRAGQFAREAKKGGRGLGGMESGHLGSSFQCPSELNLDLFISLF